MATTELLFFPLPAMGHMTPMVELAKRLVQRDSRISIAIFIIKLPVFQNNSYIKSLDSHPDFISQQIKFLELPVLENPPNSAPGPARGMEMMKQYKPLVKQVIEEKVIKGDSVNQLGGIVLDFFCTPIMDVASELNVPSYIFYATNCALLNLGLYFQRMRDDHGVDITQVTDQNAELDLPGFESPIPYRLLPGSLLDKDGGGNEMFLNHSRRYRRAKGILVNSFEEVESYPLRALTDDTTVPTIYPVGPIINLDTQTKEATEGSQSKEEEVEDSILKWLDKHPAASVVFLCFGSLGSFPEDQVREIAKALEGSSYRFLWSLRRAAKPEEKLRMAVDQEDPATILPDGFLDRTADRGRVIGWAPQVTILSHPAVGGFFSHCGWNSTLEGLWFGVPIAAWPMYAEQQINAFRLVKELGLAVEIRMDYRSDPFGKTTNGLVEAEVIENGIRKLMAAESEEMRNKVKEMSEACRNATKEGGSSYAWLGRFTEDVLGGTAEK
ncbi:putative UDP-glucose flavonoid 3-O-glucosyltransferase 3 [Drosera capensis]